MSRHTESSKRTASMGAEYEVEVTAPEPGMGEDRFVIQGETLERWFSLTVCNREWVFGFISSAALEKEENGEKKYAVTFPVRAIVVFDSSLKKNRRELEDICFHELNHVGYSGPMANTGVLMSLFGARTEKQAGDREENVVSYLTGNIARSLFDAKIMKLPKIPR